MPGALGEAGRRETSGILLRKGRPTFQNGIKSKHWNSSLVNHVVCPLKMSRIILIRFSRKKRTFIFYFSLTASNSPLNLSLWLYCLTGNCIGKCQSVAIVHKTRSLPGFLPVLVSEGSLPLNLELEYYRLWLHCSLPTQMARKARSAAGYGALRCLLALHSGACSPLGMLATAASHGHVCCEGPCFEHKLNPKSTRKIVAQ